MHVHKLVIPVCLAASVFACKPSKTDTVAPTNNDSGNTAPTPTAVPVPASSTLEKVPREISSKVKLKKLAGRLSRPVLVVAAPGDTRQRLFVVEQTGTIRFFENGTLSNVVVLNVSAEISSGNEQGLLGLAFHPEFATNQKFYIYLTDARGTTRVSEWLLDVKTSQGKRVREIFTVAQPYSNHNGGHIAFGPDANLYIGLGDGGSAGDPKRNGQNPTALLGKLLKLNVNDATATAVIVHLGLRNPWRFSFDSNGDLYIGDVGQNKYEQLYVVSGKDDRKHNFGWNVVEGNHCFEDSDCDRSLFTPPAADYSHEQGCSVTGGFVYRGKAIPALQGQYFYADYCTAIVRSFAWQALAAVAPLGSATGVLRNHWDWRKALDPNEDLSEISSFGTDAAGELYIVSLTGGIFQLVPSDP
jgi:glucose/arabinose dehydrogenase